MAPEEGANIASTKFLENLSTFLRFLLLRRTNFGVKVMHLRHLTQKKYISKTSTEVLPKRRLISKTSTEKSCM